MELSKGTYIWGPVRINNRENSWIKPAFFPWNITEQNFQSSTKFHKNLLHKGLGQEKKDLLSYTQNNALGPWTENDDLKYSICHFTCVSSLTQIIFPNIGFMTSFIEQEVLSVRVILISN